MAYPVDRSARSQWGVEDSALREVPGSLKKLVPLQQNLPKHSKLPRGALRGCRGEAPLCLGGAQRGESRAPKGGLPPLAEVTHQGGIVSGK